MVITTLSHILYKNIHIKFIKKNLPTLVDSRYSDSLRAGRSGDRIPVGTKFSALVHTGRGAQPVSNTMGRGSFPGEKRPGRSANHQPPSNTEVNKRVLLYLHSPSGPSWSVLGEALPFTLHQLL